MFVNQILVCGGSTSVGDLNCIDSIEVLDLNDNPPTWHEFAVNLPVKVHCHKCVVYDNRLLIVGGATSCSSLFIQVALSHEEDTNVAWSGVI